MVLGAKRFAVFLTARYVVLLVNSPRNTLLLPVLPQVSRVLVLILGFLWSVRGKLSLIVNTLGHV